MTYSATISEVNSIIGGELIYELDLDQDTKIIGIANDSRKVSSGFVYVAIKGSVVDGHNFIPDAVKNGASLIISSSSSECKCGGVPIIKTKDTRIAFDRLAALFCGDPQNNITSIGITGTNGKTTTCFITWWLLNKLGILSSRIGTIGVGIGWEEDSNAVTLTTPDSKTIYSTIQKAVEYGCKYNVMEVSSHALDQHRADSVGFKLGIYTNITRDHLDYHQSMEHYLDSKLMLAELISAVGGFMAINIDCPYSAKFLRFPGLNTTTFGIHKDATVRIISVEQNFKGSIIKLNWAGEDHEFNSSLLGSYNAHNLVGALIVLSHIGINREKLFSLCNQIPPVPGRLEQIISKEGVIYFVDYAHTPDALEKALKAITPLKTGKLWVVFGCGGDRDPGKRPQMGKIAFNLADKLIITSDNPRSEPPQKIIDDILVGISGEVIVEVDRAKAISKVVKMANSGDVVLVAGKGHEDYQILGDKKIYFSDIEEIKKGIRGGTDA